MLTLRAEMGPSAETFQFIHLGPVETTSTENQLPSPEKKKKNPILRMGIDNLFGPALTVSSFQIKSLNSLARNYVQG